MSTPICGYRICEFIPEAAQQAITSASQFMGRSFSYISNTPIVIPEFAKPVVNTVSQFLERSFSYISNTPIVIPEFAQPVVNTVSQFLERSFSHITSVAGIFADTLLTNYEHTFSKCNVNITTINGRLENQFNQCKRNTIQGNHILDFIRWTSNSVKTIADSAGNIFGHAIDETSRVFDRVMPEQVKNVAYRVNAAIPYEAKIAALFCIAAFGVRHIYKSYHKKPEVKNDRFTIISDALKNAPQKITELFFVAKQQISTFFGK